MVPDQIPPAIKVARGTTYLYTQGIMGNLIAVIYFAYAARVLTQTEIGVLATLSLISMLVLTTATLALPNAATRYIAQYMGRGEPTRSKRVYKVTVFLGIALAAGFATFTVAVSGIVSTSILGGQTHQVALVLLGIDIFPVVLSYFFTGTLSGLQKFRAMAVAAAVQMIGRSLLAILLLAAGKGVQGVVTAWIMAYFAALSLYAVFTHRSFAQTTAAIDPSISDEVHISKLLKYSAPLYVSNLVTYFASQVDKYLVLFFLAPRLGMDQTLAQLGIYNLAVVAVSVVGLMLNSLATTLFPQLSEKMGKSGKDAVDQASRLASRYISIAFIPMAVGLAVVAYPTVTVFVGLPYAPGSTALAIVSIAAAITSLAPLVNSILLTIGSTRVIMEGSIISIAVAVGAGYPLVQLIGIDGAALTRAALLVTGFSYTAYRLTRIHGLQVDGDAIRKSCMASAAMALAVVSFELLFPNRYLLPAYVGLGGLVYVVALKALRLVQPEDVALIEDFLPARLRGVARRIGALLVERKSIDQPQRNMSENR